MRLNSVRPLPSRPTHRRTGPSPGKPWKNGTDESFNGKFRNECLSLKWFRNRTEAKIGIERWRRHYNEERPYMSLGDLTPAECKAQMGTTHRWLGESQRASFSSNQWSEETGHVRMSVSDAKRLKELETENSRLKKLLAQTRSGLLQFIGNSDQSINDEDCPCLIWHHLFLQIGSNAT